MAKFDVFNGKIDEPPDSEKKLNTWYDDLLWCPSQCYYYFMHGDDMFCIYLRWRHQDPWTAEVFRCEKGVFDFHYTDGAWRLIKVPYFEDYELEKLKEYVMARLDIIMALWPYSDKRISLHVEEYKALPDDVRTVVLDKMAELIEANRPTPRRIRTTHGGEVKAFDTLLRMEVRDYLSLHKEELMPGDGVYINPDTADITVTNRDKVTDPANFFPFTSLVCYDRKNGIYKVDKDAIGNIAFTYYAFGTSREDICEQEGHDYRYNSSWNSLPPTKRICAWCHKKWKADYTGDIINVEIWHEVDHFDGQTRSDEELIESWFK